MPTIAFTTPTLAAGHMPLAVARPEGFDPFWVVTRHADILEISRQNELFHNGDLPDH